MKPFSTPKLSTSTLAMGARQLVVQLALEITSFLALSCMSSVTPRQIVTSGPLAGAEMITFLARASRCLPAAARSVTRPVDSMTTSAPSSFQGSLAGSVSLITRTRLPSMTRASSSTSTAPGKTPWTESYLNRWPRVFASVRSLIATNSMSAPCLSAARMTSLPMRPKPLTPTLTLISPSLSDSSTAYQSEPGRGVASRRLGRRRTRQGRDAAQEDVARAPVDGQPLARVQLAPGQARGALALDHLQVHATDHGRLAQALGRHGGVRRGPAAGRQDGADLRDHGDVFGHRVRPQQHDVLGGRLGQQLADLLGVDRHTPRVLSLIHISEPTRLGMISYAVFCLKKKKTNIKIYNNE